MSSSKEILNAEEVEFLLEASVSAGDRETDEQKTGGAAGTQQVTMRGDLQQINLADIFQTLGLAKLEGLLKITNPIEQRQVFFAGGQVQILVPPRTATRRLGQRLVQAGVVEPDRLREALIEQRKQHRPLGELLVAGGHVSQEQIDEVVAMQVTEELFGLFTWDHGEFEFWRGPCQDPATTGQLETCPRFEVNSLLLEVARRAEEWESILAALRSLGEIPVPAAADAGVEDLDEQHRAVLAAVDGRHSYRELSELTMTSLFDCARAARDLVQHGLLAHATDEHMLEVARWHMEQNQRSKALMVAQTMRDRPGDRPLAIVRELGNLLRTCGENGLACCVVLEAAQLQTDPKVAMELSREARAHDPRDLGALSFLRTTMLAHLPPDCPEVEQITLALLDGLLADGDADRVLMLTAEARQFGSPSPDLLMREARAMARKKDPGTAVQVLLEVAGTFAQKGERAREIEAYELVLRLDRGRKDIAKLLKQLRTTPRTRIARIGAIAAAVVLLGSSSLVWFTARVRGHRLLQAGAEVAAALKAGDRSGAGAALQRWRALLGDCQEIEDLQQQVRFAEATAAQRQHAEARRQAADRLQRAGESVLAGDLDAAFQVYSEMRGDEELRTEVDEAANARIDALTRDLEDTVEHLPGLLPEPPSDLTERQQIEDTLTMLRRRVSERQLSAARALLQLRDRGAVPDLIAVERRQRLLRTAERAEPLLARGLEMLRVYEAAAQRHDTQRRLDPLFKSAIESERKLDFAGALQAYRELERAQAGSTDMLAHFRRKIQDLEVIVGACAAIEAATRIGDFTAAKAEYLRLRAAHPQIPFDQFLRLPVTVRTSMPGAKVVWNGTELGTTPHLASYVPAARNVIELGLNRFCAEQLTLPPNHGGTLDVILTLRADWQCDLAASIDQPIGIDGQGIAFAVDRSGAVLAIDARRQRQVWRQTTGDTAGYLSPPLLHRDHVLVASLDGPCRALTRAGGAIAWQRNGLPTEFAPVLWGGRLTLATTRNALVQLDPDHGEELLRVPLPASPHADLVAADGRLFAALADGTTIALAAANLAVVWRSAPGSLGQHLLATAHGLLTQLDDGQTKLVDPATGAIRWRRQLPATPVGRPAVDGDALLVTLDDRVVLLDLRDGSEMWSAKRPDDGWLGSARFLGRHLAAPTRNGSILIYTRESMSPCFRLEGDRRDFALAGDGADFVLAAAGRRLSLYRRLP